MRFNNGLSIFAMMFFLSAVCFVQAAEPNQPIYKDLFVSGQDGYHTYRIPAIIVAPSGDVLAFCEGRRNNKGDSGNIDLLMKRSIDGGKTFGPQSVVWDDANNTCGNPCPVVDSNNGRIWLFSTWNLGTDHEKEIKLNTSRDTRRVYVLYSDDNGQNWSKPREITKDVKKDKWRWYATGPGVGIQLQYGKNKGRLVMPCDFSFQYSDPNKNYGSHIVYSDDHGKTWRIGGVVSGGTNECQVVECIDGSLILNMRTQRETDSRAVAYSKDGGRTLKNLSFVSNLQEPRCQASIIRYSPNKFIDKNIILFSNPNHANKRLNMTVKLSFDEGKKWPVEKCLYEGPSAYSCLTVLPDGKIACFYEAGEKMPYEKIVLAVFSLDYLTNDK
jgi:sialidase-1